MIASSRRPSRHAGCPCTNGVDVFRNDPAEGSGARLSAVIGGVIVIADAPDSPEHLEDPRSRTLFGVILGVLAGVFVPLYM